MKRIRPFSILILCLLVGTETLPSRSPFIFLAPPSAAVPSFIPLSENQKKILEGLQQKGILLHPTAPTRFILYKLKEALELGFDIQRMESQEVLSEIAKLDLTSNRDFIRFFPISLQDGTPCIGVNLLNDAGIVQHLIIKPIQKETGELRLPPNSPEQIADLNRRIVDFRNVCLSEIDSPAHEKKWIAQLKRESLQYQLPVPRYAIAQTRKKIQEFFLGNPDDGVRGVPEQVEELLLTPGRSITIGEFLQKFPEAVGYFEEAFEDFQKNPEQYATRPIPRDTNATNKKTYFVTIINRILQEIFIQRFGSPADGVADFSNFSLASVDGGGAALGPAKVNTLLKTFIAAIEDAIYETGKQPAEIRFKRPPTQVFGEWLEGGAQGDLKLELAGENDLPGFTLDQGVLIFDVDMTLLAKGESFLGPKKPDIFFTLHKLLRLGVPIRIISGGTAQTQYEKVLKPLEDYLAEKKQKQILKNLEMYTGTGSVRIVYDEDAGTFVRDLDYCPKPLINLNEAAQEIGALDKQLKEDLGGLMKGLFGRGGNGIAPSEAASQALAQKENWFKTSRKDFKDSEPDPKDAAFFIQTRDGVSLCLSGVGLTVQNKANEKNGMSFPFVELTEEGAQWIKENLPAAWNKYQHLYIQDRTLRTFVKFILDYWGAHGVDAQKKLYRKFDFSPSGTSSIDVTFKGLTKATPARMIFSQPRSDGSRFLKEASVYFGDEFQVKNGIRGNDIPLRADPALQKLKVINVGEESLRPSAFPIWVRTVEEQEGIKRNKTLRAAPDTYLILDSLDNARNIIQWLEQPTGELPAHSYTASLFYFDIPILAMTLFVNEPEERLRVLTSQLGSDTVVRRTVPSAYNLQQSPYDSMETDFVFFHHLQEWLTQQNIRRDPEVSRGSYTMRRLIDPSETLLMSREGHVPKSKIGYFAHAFLQGIETYVLDGKGPQPLFPLDAKKLTTPNDWYGTVYSFVAHPQTQWLVEKILGFLRQSQGEKLPIEWPQPNLLLETAI